MNHPRFQKIQSLVRRNDWKKAYKEAAFLVKQSNQPEVRELLVTTLWGWIKDQVRRDQYEDARQNVQELLRQPNISTEIRAEFPSVFRVLGLNSLLPENQREDATSPEIQAELVDLFLLRGNKTADLLPETLVDAERVLAAFQQIEAKDDTEALERLRPIGFRSPLADWRLFLRGLVDHYHGDDAKAEESWRRLAPDRPPFRIVGNLRKLLQEKPTSTSQGIVASFFNLFRSKNDSPTSRKSELLDTLRTLDGYLKQEKYKELLGRLQATKALFQQEKPILFDRLLRVVAAQLIRNASPDIVRQFIDRNLPLPLDPLGNRTLALHSLIIDRDEKFRRPAWLAPPPVYWRKFVENDIDRIPSFSAKMKARAKAVVYDAMADLTIEEFCDSLDEVGGNEDRLNQMIDVQRTRRVIDDLLEKAIANDPTYLQPYLNQQRFFLATLPEAERALPFHPQRIEINERLLQHIPDAQEPLAYLFDYHLDAQNLEEAGVYFNKLRKLDPLSRNTLFHRSRLCLARIRKGLHEHDFNTVDAAFRDLNDGPPLESIFYRFDVLPLALGYLAELLRGNSQGADDFFAAAVRLGIEKRLPMVFAAIVEGRELGLPQKFLHPLESEWSKTISGRCNGNTAGVLGDLAFNVLISPKRHSKSQELAKAVCQYVNRAGQVKWNAEKDLFGACNFLWHLAVEKNNDEYRATYRNLVRKGLKQYPQSPCFLFFDAETSRFEEIWPGSYQEHRAAEKYQEFLRRIGSHRDDLQFGRFAMLAEQRLHQIDNPDDDDVDDDWDGDEIPLSLPPGFEFPPEVCRQIQQSGGFSETTRQALFKALPKEMGPFRDMIIDALEECLLKGIPVERFEEMMKQKMRSMSSFEQMAFMLKMAQEGTLGAINDDEDEDDFPPRRKFQRRK